jgi:hypothetical protein
MCVLSLCSAALAELDPDGTVQAVKWETDDHPITDVERIEFVVTTRQHGDFSNVIRFYVDLEDAEGKKYVASGEGKFYDNYGDQQLTRVSSFYINDEGKLKVKGYWVGFYFMDASGEHLLSSKNRKIDDLGEWLESTKGRTKIPVESGSTELRPAI